MSELTISIVSLIVGVLASVWVSRYYFRRSVDKALIPYIQFSSSLFNGVDPSVRESLKISYKGKPVTDLYEIQFLIANAGERPIRDIIAPLSLNIPEKCVLLDASILHISPEGRDVDIEHTENEAHFHFPLLNSNEFFIAKLLIQGHPTRKDFIFTITVDDLPPTIKPLNLPHDLIESESGKKREFELSMLITGIILLLIGAAFAGLIYLQWPTLKAAWDEDISKSYGKHWMALTSSIVAVIPAILFIVVGPMLMAGSYTDFSFPKKKRFRVPSSFMRRRFYSPLPEVSDE